MCHTERYQHNISGQGLRTWTFRTVHLPNVKRENVQTVRFDYGNSECCISVAWYHEDIVSLRLSVAADGDLPRCEYELENDLLLKLYLQDYPGSPDGVPCLLREFLNAVPDMLQMIVSNDGDINQIDEQEIASMDHQLSGTGTV